jgi:hypothetical protein
MRLLSSTPLFIESTMTKELKRLSKAELIDLALRQQARIRELEAALARLEARITALESRSELLTGTGKAEELARQKAQPSSTSSLAKLQKETEQAIRDALRHLDDSAYLAQSRLAGLIAEARGAPPAGLHLQQLLYRAIESLKSVEDQHDWSRQQFRYNLLHMTYLERKRSSEVAQLLLISDRQYYRELKAAIRSVAGHIRANSQKKLAEIGQKNLL